MRQVVDAHEAPLTRYASRMLGNVETARDVVQDVFLRLWQADRDAVEPRLAPWLYTVCRNRVLDVLRKEGRMKTTADGTVTPVAPARPATPDGAADVLRMLDQLPDRQQEVIRLKFQCGLTYREIGEVLDLTVSHVGVLIHNGLKSVREKLAAAPPLDPSVTR
jgi:RNA polymerase sigma-70 factor (ECF subfamily)